MLLQNQNDKADQNIKKITVPLENDKQKTTLLTPEIAFESLPQKSKKRKFEHANPTAPIKSARFDKGVLSIDLTIPNGVQPTDGTLTHRTYAPDNDNTIFKLDDVNNQQDTANVVTCSGFEIRKRKLLQSSDVNNVIIIEDDDD